MTRVRDHGRMFPFAAIIGQDSLKQALLINAIVPGGVGVLVRGEKGTGKSTCARALARLLPDIPVVRGCLWRCDPSRPPDPDCPDCSGGERPGVSRIPFPFVTLPVNASEDNLAGGLDFEHALKTGRKRFQPGLLARAHRGILYVDEVNLLDDHLTDLITDAAASGVNIVEREGVSFRHPARFSVVATMNPEEGELRPQFLDRFGLCVAVAGIPQPFLRVELLRRLTAFERDPAAFLDSWEEALRRERQRLAAAILAYGAVSVPEKQRQFISVVSRRANAAGHRADIFAEKAARALAAYDGRTTVSDHDVMTGLRFALAHRARPEAGKGALSVTAGRPEESPRETTPYYASCSRDPTGKPGREESLPSQPDRGVADGAASPGEGEPSGGSVVFDIADSVAVSARDVRHQAARQKETSGRRHRSVSDDRRGRYIRFTQRRTGGDIALDATIRAAAVHQKDRPRGPLAVTITPDDIREKIREHRARALLIFVVDASGSMGTRLMGETKGAILRLLLEAYQNRDQISLIAFRDRRAEILLPPTNCIELARKKLRDLPAGGKTPLAAGLIKGYELACSGKRRNRNIRPVLILVSDGKANVGARENVSYSMERAGRIYEEVFAAARIIRGDRLVRTLVINTEMETMGGFGMAERIAGEMGARLVAPHQISAGIIAGAVRELV